jgi:hypothetical protein
MVVSLDDQPLKRSKRILIQAMTEAQPYGFKIEEGKILNLGGAPFGVKEIEARLSMRFEGEGVPTVTALDENGYATQKPVNISGDEVTNPVVIQVVIQLAADAIYHIIQR